MKKKEKMAAGFLIFLICMWICTLISKSVYASKLPRVTTAQAEKRRIEHVVETDGIVKQGSDVAVNTLPGLRVQKICVRMGDEVEEGSELFWLDKEDLEEVIEAKKLEAAKLEYQIRDLKENRALGEIEKQKGIRRAGEDRETAQDKAETALERADEELRQAESKLDRWKQQEDVTVSGNLVAGEDSEKEALEKNVQNAEYGREDALTEGADSLRNADRSLEDANMPDRSDSTLEIYQMELEKLKREIEKYREIYKADGKVVSDRSGTVTKVNVTVGERTVDGAAVVCADKEVPYQFETLITKEQKKYVNQGDTVTLDTPEGKSELTINYLEEDISGSYRAVVYLPEGKGVLGMSGTLIKREASESFDCCIPIDALHKEGMGERYYIYLVGEREGILGRERYVEMRYVKVEDMNDSYAALENGEVSKEEQVITGSDKEIGNNTVIRVE